MELIKVSAEYLADQGVDNARLNAELLLGHVLDMDRLKLYLEHDRPVVPIELETYRELIRRRGQRVPLQLLLGNTQILDHAFLVREGVFIPRPETETLILEVQRLEVGTAPRILEVGVGTGCVGLSLLKHWSRASLIGYDINPLAIELTTENARLLEVDSRITLHARSPFGDTSLDSDSFDLVVSNPPYVLHDDLEALEPEVRDHDPREALDGGDDGLDVVRRLIDLARRVLRPGGWVVFEHGYDQGETAPALLRDTQWEQVGLVEDLGGRPRVSLGRRG